MINVLLYGGNVSNTKVDADHGTCDAFASLTKMDSDTGTRNPACS